MEAQRAALFGAPLKVTVCRAPPALRENNFDSAEGVRRHTPGFPHHGERHLVPVLCAVNSPTETACFNLGKCSHTLGN